MINFIEHFNKHNKNINKLLIFNALILILRLYLLNLKFTQILNKLFIQNMNNG